MSLTLFRPLCSARCFFFNKLSSQLYLVPRSLTVTADRSPEINPPIFNWNASIGKQSYVILPIFQITLRRDIDLPNKLASVKFPHFGRWN